MFGFFAALLGIVALASVTAILLSFAIWASKKIWTAIRSGESLFDI